MGSWANWGEDCSGLLVYLGAWYCLSPPFLCHCTSSEAFLLPLRNLFRVDPDPFSPISPLFRVAGQFHIWCDNL
ncbi:hypothetical protein J1614_007648 [Plenodomus biglobosus]|nr:hypothetical protein J1614_007648 [Plenodomus biglobosus]